MTPAKPFYLNDSRYLRWRDAIQRPYWVIDRHWYRLFGWLGENCFRPQYRHDIMSSYPNAMVKDLRYGRFDRALLLRNLNTAPSTILFMSGEAAARPPTLNAESTARLVTKDTVASVAMELFRARKRIPKS